MEIAIHNWMRSETLEHTLKRISGLGYSHLEIKGNPKNLNTTLAKELLDKYHIKCWGSVTLMIGERNLIAKDANQRNSTIQYIKDVAKMVYDLNGAVISLVPATVGNILPQASAEEEWTWAVEGIQEIYNYTEDLGLKIGIEPINRFETYFINRGDQALALAEAVGPNCGVCLDTFHMNFEEVDMYATIKKVGDRLVNFHVSDNNRMAPGMGHLNWSQIMNSLNEIGYNKMLSVEFCPPLDRTPANPYPNSIEINTEALPKNEMKFLEVHGSSAITDEFYTMLSKASIDTLKKYAQYPKDALYH